MTPLPTLLALQFALASLWLEAWGIDPAPIFRECADVLDATKPRSGDR